MAHQVIRKTFIAVSWIEHNGHSYQMLRRIRIKSSKGPIRLLHALRKHFSCVSAQQIRVLQGFTYLILKYHDRINIIYGKIFK